jgi:hypothetical protein
MSAALTAGNMDDSDYAANYIRMQGELPVRWASVRVQSNHLALVLEQWPHIHTTRANTTVALADHTTRSSHLD